MSPAAFRSTSMIFRNSRLGAYWQQTIGLLPTTDFSYGGRIQRTSVTATDQLNNAPGCAAEFSCDTQAARWTAVKSITPCISASNIASTTFCGVRPRRERVPHA